MQDKYANRSPCAPQFKPLKGVSSQERSYRYGQSLKLFREILGKHCSGMSGAEAEQVMYIFFPFMFGIYPYAEVTAKQKDAMTEAEVDNKYQSIYEITYNCLIKLLLSSDQSGK